MPPNRSVRRFNRRYAAAGAFGGAARAMGYAWRNRKRIQAAGRFVGKSIRNAWTRKNQIVTQQRDISTSKPKRAPRPNKRFAKRVENVISAHSGKNTVVFQATAATNTAGSGTQNFMALTLFGANGAANHNADMAKLLSLHEDPTDLENANLKNLFVDYGVLTFHLRAKTENTTQSIVTIYEYKTRGGMATYTDFDALLAQMLGEEEVLNDPGAIGEIAITLNQLGITPYQLTNVCKNIIIGKKTVVLLEAGKAMTYTMARKKKKWLTGQKVVDRASYALRGWTEGIIIIHHGAPGAGTNAVQSQVDLSFSRKYSWRAMDPDAKNEYMYEIF